MNRELEGVLKRVRAMPDGRQREIAEVLLAFLDQKNPDLHLSAKKIAKVERAVPDDGPYATDEEVRAMFARLTQ